jgi:hypothetical protein
MEQVAPQIARDGHETVRRHPAADPPQHVVRCDQTCEQAERCPDRTVRARRQRVDQVLHRILRGDRASHRQDDGHQHHEVPDGMTPHITEDESDRSLRNIDWLWIISAHTQHLTAIRTHIRAFRADNIFVIAHVT